MIASKGSVQAQSYNIQILQSKAHGLRQPLAAVGPPPIILSWAMMDILWASDVSFLLTYRFGFLFKNSLGERYFLEVNNFDLDNIININILWGEFGSDKQKLIQKQLERTKPIANLIWYVINNDLVWIYLKLDPICWHFRRYFRNPNIYSLTHLKHFSHKDIQSCTNTIFVLRGAIFVLTFFYLFPIPSSYLDITHKDMKVKITLHRFLRPDVYIKMC